MRNVARWLEVFRLALLTVVCGLVLAVPWTVAAQDGSPGGAATIVQTGAQSVGGVVRPLRRAVLSFARDGLIVFLAAEGAEVAAGDVLGRLDERQAVANLRNARIRTEAAAIGVDEARHDRDVQKDLLKDDIITEEAYRNLEIKVRYSQMQQRSSEAAEAVAELDVDDCTLRAPFSGVVARAEGNVAEWAGRGKPIMELVDVTHLELTTDIPPELARSLATGTEVAIRDAGEAVGLATVRVMLPLLDPASGLRRVIWDVRPAADVLSGRYVVLDSWWQ
ncbi:efflux RND transporter periplasmic adaptor subunit [Desulfobaculum xiamenense]|nr:HlyD family efflux transporter periplasmic adaptor subunit [Desulfobaculum xiamenense]